MEHKVAPIISKIFEKRLSQTERLIKNIELYEQKKKIEQSKSKVLGQKPVKGKTNKGKETNMHNSPRV